MVTPLWQLSVSSQQMVKSLTLNPYMSLFNNPNPSTLPNPQCSKLQNCALTLLTLSVTLTCKSRLVPQCFLKIIMATVRYVDVTTAQITECQRVT